MSEKCITCKREFKSGIWLSPQFADEKVLLFCSEKCKKEYLKIKLERIETEYPQYYEKYISDAEQKAHACYIKTRNFLSELFGENFRDLNTFEKCFGKYTQKSLYTESYMGSVRFVKEDMEKGVGVLNGIYSSFKEGQIKRQSKIKIYLTNFYYELKDWGKIAGGVIKNY